MKLSVLLCRFCGMTLMLPLLSLANPAFANTAPAYSPPANTALSSHHPSHIQTSAASMSSDILRYVNDHRRSIGLKSLQANSFISSVALEHSRNMLSGKTRFGHDGLRQRIERIGNRLGPVRIGAENVASGPMSAREVVNGWLHSPGHRKNIEGDFKLTGIGLATRRDGVIYFTQIFVR
ncbi:CAP domain-containing protein [Flavitalea sp. BT771]|uniref:CAP domain-containing protein n=1 Tax=Flavitalea sp. BT771 TaxID=3063329 RepID=UPI0026E3A57B|nr:CAP domain-containing protein [Flavitalea sp. BT771]MDO6430142.1 CAP domain-containing protein [Flavitalea sp. BT771]MDV6219719.1 CAP domain-containing protein [Flavitalea sp. BT771]